MNGRRLALRALAGLGALAAAVGGGWTALQFGRRAPSQDDASALFALTLPDGTGTPVALSSLRGRRLVVNFWATWCAPCVQEMPDLKAFAAEHAGSDVTVVGLAIDQVAKVGPFLRRLDIDYPVFVVDAKGLDLLRSFGHPEASLPFTVIVDRDGRIRHRVLGRVVPDDLRTQVRQLADAGDAGRRLDS